MHRVKTYVGPGRLALHNGRAASAEFLIEAHIRERSEVCEQDVAAVPLTSLDPCSKERMTPWLEPSADRLIPKQQETHMCKWMPGRHDCDVVESDVARAKSLLIGLRVKIDNGGDRRAQAYGQALVHVAGLLSTSLSIAASDALLARGIRADDLDNAFRDLQRSAARCRTFLDQPSPIGEIADSLAVACTILSDLYRMRFHALKAGHPQRSAAADQARIFVEVVEALVHPIEWNGPIRRERPLAA